jgi:hypothetical protein
MEAPQRCSAVKDGQQCVLAAGHTEPHQLQADPGWAAPAAPTVSAPVAQAPALATPRPVAWGGIVILIAAGLAILGSFLPWISATAALIGTLSRSGLDNGGDGRITIGLGILIALFGVALLLRSGKARIARVGTVVCAIALGYTAWIDIQDVNNRIASLDSGNTAIGSLGMGLIIVAFAAVLAFVGALIPPPQTA